MCFLCLVWTLHTAAESAVPRLTQYGHVAWRIQDGQFSSPNSIAQTADGYLWLGTDAGLVRFDGVRFVPWNTFGGESIASWIVTAVVAAKDGKSIPLGWALDADGQPTTDPKAGMMGSMLPVGAASSPKGAMLALMVELLVTAVIGAQFGFEASSFFVDEGNQPRIGQAFIVVDPGALAGTDVYLDRMEVVIHEMLRDDGVRLAGARRLALERKAAVDGITIPDALLAQLQTLAA